MWKGAGTVRTILRFPDPRLRANAEHVTVFDDGLRSLAADLLDTMRAAPGIRITKRLVVIELAATDGVRTYVNPQIVWTSADRIRHEEAVSPCRA
jgi:peptide deformylase